MKSLFILPTNMPLILRGITVCCFLGTIFLFYSLIPFGSYSIGEKEVTFVEFWKEGAGTQMFIVGSILLAITIGFLKRNKWASIALISLFVFFGFIQPVFSDLAQFTMEKLLKLLFANTFTVVPLTLYLFFNKSVKEFYEN